jgi:NAD(P)-dependent dehydrogenase (short-subunit alcohol dehydrogenase family)
MSTREPELLGQTVVVLGGSAGIGLETARRARAEGAEVVVTGRDPERLERAAVDVGARSSAAFDAADPAALGGFFEELPQPIDHVMCTAGRPNYDRLADMDYEQTRDALNGHMMLALEVGRHAGGNVRPGGSLIFIGGTGGRRPSVGVIASTVTIAPGFVDTPLSASLLGDQLDERRDELRAKLPIGRVVEPEDVAALAVHLMSNTALTGATYDIDGGQQLVSW